MRVQGIVGIALAGVLLVPTTAWAGPNVSLASVKGPGFCHDLGTTSVGW
jgi:hypothetical protein